MGRGSPVDEKYAWGLFFSEGTYKLTIRDSEQLKTISALYNQDTVQKGELVSFTPLKHMAKKNLE